MEYHRFAHSDFPGQYTDDVELLPEKAPVVMGKYYTVAASVFPLLVGLVVHINTMIISCKVLTLLS